MDFSAAPSPWLPAHQVHLWRAPLDVSSRLTAQLAGTLSQDELDRAARLRSPVDQSRAIAARGWLRHLLGRYLGAHPKDVVLALDQRGKPRLRDPAQRWLRFNLSHTRAMAVIALSREREVGVDAEEVRDDVDIEGVARRSFTVEQQQHLAGLGPEARTAAFFTAWTRHEAYVKARGAGLAGRGALGSGPGWVLAAFDAGPGYAAAVAVEGEDVEIPEVASDVRGLLDPAKAF